MKTKQSKPAAYFDVPAMNVHTAVSAIETLSQNPQPICEIIIKGNITGENEVLNIDEIRSTECTLFKLKFLDDFWENQLYAGFTYSYNKNANISYLFFSSSITTILIGFDYDRECYHVNYAASSGEGGYVLPGEYRNGVYFAKGEAYARLAAGASICYVPGLGICSVYNYDSDHRMVYLVGTTCDKNEDISIVSFNPFSINPGEQMQCHHLKFKFNYKSGTIELDPALINEKLASLEERIAALEN